MTPRIFIRTDKPRKNGECSLMLLLRCHDGKFHRSIGVAVRPEHWHQANQCVLPSHPQHKSLNLTINDCLARAHQIIVNYQVQRKTLNRDNFKQEFLNPSTQEDFIDFMEQERYRQLNLKNIGAGTFRVQGYVIERLKEWKPQIMFSEISRKLITDFDLWHAEHLEKRGFEGEAQREKALVVIRRYIRLALEAGKKCDYPFGKGKIKVGYQADETVFLTEAEVERLIELYRKNDEFMTDSMRTVLRAFLFQCFTGLRYSDLRKLRREHIVKGTIIMKPTKTKGTSGVMVQVPITKPARRFMVAGPIPVPTLSYTHTRPKLKRVAKMARVKKNVTTHVGRHTFATMFLERGGKVELLQQLLGHKSIETTMIYTHLTSNRMKRDMKAAFDDFM